MRSSASAAFRSPSTCMASARRSSSWCGPRARCTPSRIAPGARNATFFDGFDGSDPEYDTEAVYFELLREIGRTLELRVIVDIIAGASAGGINGTMLARALSHDLPMEALRELWLKNADVDVLLSPRGAGAPVEQVVPAAAVLGRRGDRPVPHHHRHGGAAETVAVRALALVPAAARRPRDGRPDVRRRDLDGRGEGSARARCCPPASCSTCSSR